MHPEHSLTPEEQALLAPHVSNLDGNVFALANLPEVVKGAMYARYSRSPKSLRRLLLDEFADTLGGGATDADGSLTVADEGSKAAALYDRVFLQYGDDSVAQLCGAHLAVEQASNLLTKQLEWGRLAAYLEQSTRYIPYDDKPGGRYRYHRPAEVMAGPHADRYIADLDRMFGAYAELIEPMQAWARATYPQDARTSDVAYRNTIRAKALDSIRGLLPAATTSNVGIFASGQAYENMLLRMAGHELAEVRDAAQAMLTELRTVIPSFLKRVDLPDRGVAWTQYLRAARHSAAEAASALDLHPPHGRPDEQGADEEVTLTAFGPPDAMIDLVTGILAPHTAAPEAQVRTAVDDMTAEQQQQILSEYVGKRTNRRHRPGRAFERPWYRFEILSDYGGFRDLQRHRMLTIEWQLLTPAHGYEMPPEVADAGLTTQYDAIMRRQAELHEVLAEAHGPHVAQYAVGFGWRMRYTMQLNARAAMQMLELRTTPQGHPAYRRVCQRMHQLIRAVHPEIAAAMSYVDHSTGELELLAAEQALDAKRAAQ